MKIYLVRHAIAMEREDFKKSTSRSDFYRPLTEHGIKKFKRLLKILKKKKLTVRSIYTSPYVRCKQTAALLADKLGVKKVRPLKALAHQNTLLGSSKKMLRELKKFKSHSFCVGHEPELSRLLRDLRLPAKDVVPFRKGEVRCLYKEKKNYRVAWTLKPSRKSRIPE